MGDLNTEVSLRLPRLGETMDEARIVSWLIEPGCEFGRGDVLLEVETDKAVVEVPALRAGRLVAALAQEGETVQVGAVIAKVMQDAPPVDADREQEPVRSVEETQPPRASPPPAALTGNTSGNVAASPAARRSARRLGVDLSAVAGTGRRGRITRADVVTAAEGPGIEGEWGPFFARLWRSGPNPEGHAVLVHGLFGDSMMFDGLARRLARSGIRAIGIDLPGHGLASDTEFDFQRCAEGLAEQLGRMMRILPKRPVLVGHSLGAALATRAVVTAGLEAGGLCLLNPIGLGTAAPGGFVAGVMDAKDPAALRDALEPLGAPPLSDDRLVGLQARLNRGRASISAIRDSVLDGDRQRVSIIGDIARAEMPVTLVLGRSDRIVPWHSDGTLDNLPPNAGVHFLSGGHSSLLTETADVFDVIHRAVLPSARPVHRIRAAGRSPDVDEQLQSTAESGVGRQSNGSRAT